jgi:hypothetical protein
MSPNEFDATLVWQPGPSTHGGLDGAICVTAICASGAATQPLRPSARVQARTGKTREENFNSIGKVPGTLGHQKALMPPSAGAERNRMRRDDFR